VNKTAAVHYSKLFYAPKHVMQLAIMDLFSSLSGFFVGQRHQLVQSLPSFFVFVFISTSSRLALIPPPLAQRTCFAPYFFF
jgi:hypothetical protein